MSPPKATAEVAMLPSWASLSLRFWTMTAPSPTLPISWTSPIGIWAMATRP